MNKTDIEIIRKKISPLVNTGEASLLLGAGFSIVNKSTRGSLPGGDGLRDMILAECNKKAGPKTTLKDAYLLGSRSIENFEIFLAQCFSVESVFEWQKKIFQYAWNSIYTTNIDNVLDIAYEQQAKSKRLGGEFAFFNYCDQGLINKTIGRVPVVSIHGTIKKLQEGFIFSSLDYAKASSRILDWHRELTAKMLTGGLIVIGNQLDESDFDTYIASRQRDYPEIATTAATNWIVTPNPDEIKAENYKAAGYHVIDATAEDFFQELYTCTPPKNIGEIVLENTPVVRRAVSNIKAMTWFKGAFSHIPSEIEDAKKQNGIVRHFLTGSDPEWFYIVNSAHAKIIKHDQLTALIGERMQTNKNGVGVLNIIGPSGSGKTTAIRAASVTLQSTYTCIYEFDENGVIDTTLLRNIIESLTEKSIFIFYSASEYYFAVSYIWEALSKKERPYCLFILEDRSSDYWKSRNQLDRNISTDIFQMGDLTIVDARKIAEKIASHGLEFKNFSEFGIERRARVIHDKEKGYGGDLLTALFSLTTHENFELKIYQDYHSTSNRLDRNILNIVSIITSLGLQAPINYVSGILGERIENTLSHIQNELDGILEFHTKQGTIKCRHRIIAQYYFNKCISKNGDFETLTNILEFLSRQFTVEDIKNHPLAYRIYKELISFEFIHNQYFPEECCTELTEKTYHLCQDYYGKDGIFWLHYGRFYRKLRKLDEAIECFKIGLNYFDSFQTRHSLGTALIEKYIESGCTEEGYYKDGLELLDNERVRRGHRDAYPTTTIIEFLLRIYQIKPDREDIKQKLVECFNFGLKYFKDDKYFKDQLKHHFSILRKIQDNITTKAQESEKPKKHIRRNASRRKNKF